jgi:hypothetical protein
MAEKRKLQYVTLIWEELPESIKLFVIPRSALRKADIRMLRACHRNYINAVGKYTELATAKEIDVALITLFNLVTDPDASWVTDNYRNEQAEQLDMERRDFDSMFGQWHQFMVDSDAPQTIPRSKMYRSGYLL